MSPKDNEAEEIGKAVKWLLTSKLGPWIVIAFLVMGGGGGVVSIARASLGIDGQSALEKKVEDIQTTLDKLVGQLEERGRQHGRRADEVARRLEDLERERHR